MHHSHQQLGTPFRIHTDSRDESHVFSSQLTQSQADAQFYQQKYHEMKSINHSIIAAIKRVYSQEVGEALELLIQQEQAVSGTSHTFPDPTSLTNTFCQKMRTYNSKMLSEQSIDQLPPRAFTPQKINNDSSTSEIRNGPKMPLSPYLGKSNHRKQLMDKSPSKHGLEEASTRRSYTPIRNTIATEILCQLCDRVFPPNQFVCHAERCKYELQYVQSQSERLSVGAIKSKPFEPNYDKMMKNLLKIREEIEQQIRLVVSSKEEVDRTSIRKTLEKDLKRVIKVINQKEEQLKKKKPNPSKFTLLAKKAQKLR